MSSLDDFATGPYRAIRRKSLKGHTAFPCVFDIARARTLHALDIDPQALREAPFSNIYARRTAKSVISVSWEAGPVNRPQVKTDPIYIFSSGRCGSTLLHKIFMAAKIHSISEPDVGEGLLSPAYRKHPLLRPILHRATANYVRDLVSALADADGRLIVKLRSQFCAAAPALMNKSTERRTIFMIRQFETWARSRAQMFRVTPGQILEAYQLSLQCYAYLREHSNCHLLRYEDLAEQPHREMVRLSEFMNHDIPTHAIDAAMAVGSQKGTRLERVSDHGRERWDAMKDEVFRRWKSSEMAELCDQILGVRPES